MTMWMWTRRVRYMLGFVLASACFASAADSGEALPEPRFRFERKRSDPNRPARANEQLYEGPIIDAHIHVATPKQGNPQNAVPEEVLEVIRANGVELAVVMPTPNEGRKDNYEEGVRLRRVLKRLDPERISLFCGSDYLTYWMHQAYRDGYSKEDLAWVLGRLSKDLQSGEYAGVGEVAWYHFEKWPRQHVLHCPPNFGPFLEMTDLVVEHGLWLEIHAEPVDPNGKSYEAEVFGGIELLMRRHPNVKLIIPHTAMTSPNNVLAMLSAYPNLMMDVKIQEKHQKWRNLEPIVNPDCELYEDWARLFERMPERFMIGTDAKIGRRGWELSMYGGKIRKMRAMLGTLDSKAARLIAYENARRVFDRQE